jgi:PiT family inorganic phosphate transporter
MLGDTPTCRTAALAWPGAGFSDIQAEKIMNLFHFLSAGAVGFARGLNDTPKIAAFSITAGFLGQGWMVGIIALAMALGGFFSAREVAETMSHKMTAMSPLQDFMANGITPFLVIFASHLGMPVSTTHVSCGAIFGIGIVNGEAKWKKMLEIFSAWLLTLPAALVSGFCYLVLKGLTDGKF